MLKTTSCVAFRPKLAIRQGQVPRARLANKVGFWQAPRFSLCWPGDGLLSVELAKERGTWKNRIMRNSRTISAEARSELVKRLQDGSESEIRAYISALKQGIAKYARPF